MRQILTVIAVLSVFALAIIGCLWIFGIISFDAAASNLVKIVAAIALLGGCAAVIAILMGPKDEPPG